MKFFAIRHKPTGYFLPEKRALGPGYTRLEPADPVDRFPHLFARRRYAKSALTRWLKGHMYKIQYPDATYSVLEVDPVRGRRVKDMEVVTLDCAVLESGQGVVDLADLVELLGYAAEQSNGRDGLSTLSWFVSLTAVTAEVDNS